VLKPAEFVPLGFKSYRLLLGSTAFCNRYCTENETNILFALPVVPLSYGCRGN